MRTFLALLLCCAMSLAATSSLPQWPANQVVARVNGAELKGDTLNDYVEAIIPDFSFHGKVQPEMINEYRRAALDRMVLHELIYQEGVRRGVEIPASKIEAEVSLEQGRFRSAEAFQQALSNRGFTLDRLRAQIRRNMVIAAVVEHDVTGRAKVTSYEAHVYYRKNLQRFREPATVHVRDIFIRSSPQALKQANDVRSQAAEKNTVEQFDQLAQRFSQDDYRVMGGDLGWVHTARLEPDLEKVAFALKPGQLSPVIQTKSGFYILRVEGKHQARTVPFSEVRAKIRGQLVEDKRKTWTDVLRARVYRNAKVELIAKF